MHITIPSHAMQCVQQWGEWTPRYTFVPTAGPRPAKTTFHIQCQLNHCQVAKKTDIQKKDAAVHVSSEQIDISHVNLSVCVEVVN